MERFQLNTTDVTQYNTNFSQVMAYPKRYSGWNSCPQYWIQQVILVQVNPGETLTIKSHDGNIQNIQGPADVPLMSPSGTLPLIYLPPGYTSHVVEENGIRKIITVPQTVDRQMIMPVPVPQISHFITPATPVYPQTAQLIYPTAQGGLPPPYVQEHMPEQLLPPPPILLPPPPPPLPPPPPPPPPLPPQPPAATFIYPEQHETYSCGRTNYNQRDERTARVKEHMKKKKRDLRVGRHRNNYMANNISLLVNKTNDISSVPDAPCTYSVDSAPRTYTVVSTSNTHAADNALHTSTVDNISSISAMNHDQNIYTADNIPSIDMADNPINTYIVDNAPSNVFTDHVPSSSTTETALHPSMTESTLSSSTMNYTPKTSTSDSTPVPSPIDNTPGSSIADNAPNTPISESAPSTSATDGALSTSDAASTSNTASAQIEISHGKEQSVMGNRNIKQKTDEKQSKSPSSNEAENECRREHGKSCCFSIEKPIVSDIQTRSAVVSWKPHAFEKCVHTKLLTFELAISNSGKMGKYKNVYTGDEVTFTLLDLQPSMVYFVRITAIRDSAQNTVSEVVSFTTPGCEPDPPLAPKLINRSKNSLNLQWKGSNDNGSKVNSFLLEWDEGKGEVFKSCYVGTMKQHKVLKLKAATKYSFRLAAKNEFGLSDFSEIVGFYTSGTVPPAPLPPKLKEAGIHNLSLEWCAPSNTNLNDSLTYVLEMEEAGSGLGFKPKYNGQDLSCTISNLQRSTTYKFRIFAYNMEGRSKPSEEVKYTTCPDKPGFPRKLYIKGKIRAHRVKIGWEPPDDNGGTYISSYSLEVSENFNVNSWNLIYNGITKEFLCDHLQPGTTYKLRVFCTSPIGQSQPSDILTIQTPTLSPASCSPLLLNGKANSIESNIHCDHPPNGNSEVLANVKKSNEIQDGTQGHSGSEMRSIFEPHSMNYETVPGPRPPSECGIPVLTCKGSTCVVISWENPVCNGAEITDYRLEWGQIEGSVHLIYTGPCLSYEIKGLVPATTYFCRVQAVNTVGVGKFGGTGTVTTPATVPAVVPILQEVENKVPAKLASSCIAVQWEEPNCHGSPITGYRIEYGDRKILTVDRVTECLLRNLQPDTTYKIRIQAINHYGLSPFSQSIRIKTKPLPPEPPHLDCVVYGHQSLKLKWGNSSRKGSLSNIRSYNLLMGDQFGRFSVIYHGPCQTHKVQRLSEYTQYEFKIQACNAAGKGPLSVIYTFTTTKTPPATLKAPKLYQVNNNMCEVKWESLEPIKGDPIVYNLQLISEKRTDLIYKGPDTSFFFSNFLTNAHYRFKVCAGRQYQNSAGLQEIWGQYSPKVLFSTHKQWPGTSKSSGIKQGSQLSEGKNEKPRIEMSVDTFILIFMIGFALLAILCAVTIQYFLIN